jgi:hypothetical protein
MLLLCQLEAPVAGMITDHLQAIVGLSDHDVELMHFERELPAWLNLDGYDAVILHYTVCAAHDDSLAPTARSRLRRYRGLKAMFIQDEYRFVKRTVAAITYLRPHLVFTCVSSDQVPIVYPRAGLAATTFRTVLTGYIPTWMRELATPAYEDREKDLAYRGRTFPLWYGEMGQDRVRIAAAFAGNAARLGLNVDISCREADRLYGAAWISFLSSSKAVLGTESGCNVFDFDGTLPGRIDAYRLPRPWAGYEHVRRRFLDGIDGRIRLNQISPRCFEAIAAGALLVLYEGDYSGVLQPWVHYVPVRKDHSNLQEVARVIKDSDRASPIIERAHRDVIASGRYDYEQFVGELDAAIEAAIEDNRSHLAVSVRAPRGGEPTAPPARRSLRDIVRDCYRRLAPRLLPLAALALRIARRVRRGSAAARTLVQDAADDSTVRGLISVSLLAAGPRGAWRLIRLAQRARAASPRCGHNALSFSRSASGAVVIAPADVELERPPTASPAAVAWIGGPELGLAAVTGGAEPWEIQLRKPALAGRLESLMKAATG